MSLEPGAGLEPPALLPSHIRASGEIRASFERHGARTGVAEAHESGGLRLRFPRVAGGCEAVVINTGGGVAGGDRQRLEFAAGAGADVTIATQAAEKIYRAQSDQTARIEVALRLEARSRLEWLPQETILFDQANLRRRLEADLDASATLTLVEAVIFGRLAMGEASIRGAFADRWRVRRDGVLIFAENLVVEGAQGELLDRPALGGGARACATLLHVAPDAEARLDAVRATLAGHGGDHGASAWDGKLVMRAASPSPERLRAVIIAAMASVGGREAPRVWRS